MADTKPNDSSQLALSDQSHQVTVTWNPKAPRRMLLATGDPRFTDENGGKPGLRTIFSANPKSADYDPAQFNRIARAMRSAGLDAPDEVPVRPRRNKQRRGVIAKAGGDQAGGAKTSRGGRSGRGGEPGSGSRGGKKAAASPRRTKKAATTRRAAPPG